ncbi:MAG: hypothetical protein QMB14_11275 [Polaromonas sp.]|jgi:hypothetical protein
MNPKSTLKEGLSDAIGFIGGALIGYWAGHLLGLDIFEPSDSNSSIAGIVLAGLGGGLGLQTARRWRKHHAD